MSMENQLRAENFYVLGRQRILTATSSEYRQFLREAGYGDLEHSSGLLVAKELLKIDKSIKIKAANRGIRIHGRTGEVLVSPYEVYSRTGGVSHKCQKIRKVAEILGYKILTVGLMYRMFIPYIKELTKEGNSEAKTTLKEMIEGYAEILEDIVLNSEKIKIGTKEKTITLLDKRGSFNRGDTNDFGYPTRVRNRGEFFYEGGIANGEEVIREGESDMRLVLDGCTVLGDGVRLVKILK